MITAADQRRRMARAIVDFEARRDSAGHLKVYQLPAGDGGGSYEVAGINDRYHPVEAARIRDLVTAGKFTEAEAAAEDVIAAYTDAVAGWHDNAGVTSYLRDCCFNRGPHGAARILQRAVGVGDDGDIGDETRRAMAGLPVADLISHLRLARERYEREVVKRDETSKFWAGLMNRWNDAEKVAFGFAAEVPEPAPAAAPAAPPAPPPGGLGAIVAAIVAAVLGLFRGAPANRPAPPQGKAPATLPAPAATTPPWMTWALKELGFHEVGQNRGLGRYTALAKCGEEGDPWCAIFVNAALEAAGQRGSRSAMARSFETDKNFVRLPGPAYGAITTMWRGSLGSGLGHVFFYVGENDKGVVALGGNQSDRVCRQYEPRTRIVGYFWPAAVPVPPLGVIHLETINAQEGTET